MSRNNYATIRREVKGTSVSFIREGLVDASGFKPNLIRLDDVYVNGPQAVVSSSKEISVISYSRLPVKMIDQDNMVTRLFNNHRFVRSGHSYTGKKNPNVQVRDFNDCVVIKVSSKYSREDFLEALDECHLLAARSIPLPEIGRIILEWFESVNRIIPAGQLITLNYDYVIPSEAIAKATKGLFHKASGLLFTADMPSSRDLFNPLSKPYSATTADEEMSKHFTKHTTQSVMFVCDDPEAGDRYIVSGPKIHRVKRITTAQSGCDEGIYVTTNTSTSVDGKDSGIACVRYAIDENVLEVQLYESLPAAKSNPTHMDYLKYLRERDKQDKEGISNVFKWSSDWMKSVTQFVGAAIALFAFFRKK